MSWTVSFNCEKCGSTRMVVTRERGEGAIDGYCLACGQQVSGFYVAISEPPAQPVSTRSCS